MMNVDRPLARFFLLSLLITLTCSCQNSSPPPQTTSFSGMAMTMPYRITLGHNISNRKLTKVKMEVLSTFNEVDQIFNKYNPESEISRINRAKAGTPIKLSPSLQALLKQTDTIVKLSGGLFDPTIEPLQQLWKESLQQGREPLPEEIEQVMPAIGWNNIHFHKEVIVKNHDLTSIDLGGIAKGLCIDRIVERLQTLGYNNLYVEWGGEIRTSGVHPENRPWNIAIRNVIPQKISEPSAYVECSNSAIATSGDYEQFWKVVGRDGKVRTYFHIIHPKTLKPLEVKSDSIASVTVKAPNCTLADALATTVMLFDSYDESLSWAVDIEKKVDDTTFWIMTRKKKQ